MGEFVLVTNGNVMMGRDALKRAMFVTSLYTAQMDLMRSQRCV